MPPKPICPTPPFSGVGPEPFLLHGGQFHVQGRMRPLAIKGNVVDIAVGIMTGGAFATVVESLVEDVVMPPISMATGGSTSRPPPASTLHLAGSTCVVSAR